MYVRNKIAFHRVIHALLLASIFFNTGCKQREKILPENVPPSPLAKLYISFDSTQKITKSNYIDAQFDFFPSVPEEGDTILSIAGKIKGRGNSTWVDMPKKPYKIKFNEKKGLFNLYAEKEWVLLANYADKTLMRNYLAYQLAADIGSPYPPSLHYVEVYLNGKHQGNYLFTDQVEVGENRVNIPELTPSYNDTPFLTGGYLLEINARAPQEDEPYFMGQKFPIQIKSPEAPSPEQLSYITNYLQTAEQALYSDDFADPVKGFRKYFDETSMIQWFIYSELFKNIDSKDFSSVYFFKNRNGKLVMGPIWDFDLSAGNHIEHTESTDPNGWFVLNSYWFGRMYQDTAFRRNVKSHWNLYKPSINAVLSNIHKLSEYLDASQKANFLLWPNFNDPSWAVPQGYLSFDAQVKYLTSFLERRMAWMDAAINNM